MEGRYQFDQPNGLVLIEEEDWIDIIVVATAFRPDGLETGAVMLSLISLNDEPQLVISSLYGSKLNPWSQYLDLNRSTVRGRPNRQVALYWSPILVPLRCGWLPSRGSIQCRFLFADESRCEALRIESVGRDATGREFFRHSCIVSSRELSWAKHRDLWLAVREFSFCEEMICYN